MAPAVEVVIENHVDQRIPVVIEGDGILPSLLERPPVRARASGGHVRAVFVLEPDPETLLGSLVARGADDWQEDLGWYASRSVAHGERLKREAALDALPPGYRRERPCTIALDNYGVHHSAPVKDALPKLAAIGVAFYYLPAYGPELNRIEPEWHALKYHGLQDRSFTIGQALKAAVDAALDERAAEIAHTRPSVLIEVRPPEHHRRRRPTVPDRIAR
ncbi:MAG TPA: transposase [Chloroflexota bacterium]